MTTNHTEAFRAALDYLYSFINFEKKKQDRYMASKIDVTRPGRLFAKLGSPYEAYPTLHIAGTKGKGSVSALCAYALRAAGLKVGLYTSPHLVDFRERIRVLTPQDVQGLIPEEEFVQIIELLKPIIEADFPDVTWFEVLTAVAFKHFANQQVDVAVVEVGLGGRLDATNVVTPLVSVITSLSLDHTQFLGETLGQIAFEKGGIIKPGVPVVVAPQPDEAVQVLRDIGAERGARVDFVEEDWRYESVPPERPGALAAIRLFDLPAGAVVTNHRDVPINLLGEHQAENGVVALAALSQVQHRFPGLTESAVRQGFSQVVWNGRLEILNPGTTNAPTLLADCAHNPDSASKLHDALTTLFQYNRLFLILGAPADKDVEGMLQILLPLAHKAIFTTASHPRSITPQELVAIAAKFGYKAQAEPTMMDAVQAALREAKPGDLICVTGSIIVVGDLLNQQERLQSLFNMAKIQE